MPAAPTDNELFATRSNASFAEPVTDTPGGVNVWMKALPLAAEAVKIPASVVSLLLPSTPMLPVVAVRLTVAPASVPVPLTLLPFT